MERKIVIIDLDKKRTEKIYRIRDVSHLENCIKYKYTITKNKKKYTRKEKHKKDYSKEEF